MCIYVCYIYIYGYLTLSPQHILVLINAQSRALPLLLSLKLLYTNKGKGQTAKWQRPLHQTVHEVFPQVADTAFCLNHDSLDYGILRIECKEKKFERRNSVSAIVYFWTTSDQLPYEQFLRQYWTSQPTSCLKK